MSRVSSAAVAAALVPDPGSPEPLYRQLYEKLRQQILTGAFGAGQQIPSSRALATDLCISRNTVVNAIEQLIAEGYLEGEAGSGTFVAEVVPEDMTSVEAGPPVAAAPARRAIQWSPFGQRLEAPPLRSFEGSSNTPRPVRPGIPAFDHFPFDVWSRLLTRCWRRRPVDLLNYGDPAGYLPLRRAIVDHAPGAWDPRLA